MTAITQEHLREMLSYHAASGQFVWKSPLSNRVKVGAIAGATTKNGYIVIGLHGKLVYAHRVAWFYMTGGWPKHQIDHVNGDRQDNRWDNLRLATPQQNSANSKRPVTNGSGYKGAYKTRNGRFQAKVEANGASIYLGTFDSAEDAHAAYMEEAVKQFGPYARSA
jgi:hypothetical protein